MSKEKKEIVETDTVEVEVKTKEESAEKQALRAHFEAYKVKNPVKYALKKDAFQKQLDAIK